MQPRRIRPACRLGDTGSRPGHPTLRGALEAIFKHRPASEVSGGEPSAIQPPNELEAARAALQAVKQALHQADWAAFGRAMQRLTDILGHLDTPGDGS